MRYNEKMSGLDERIRELELQVEENDLLGESEREEMMERISLLKGGLVMIQPGGRTEVEANESRDRIEDAVCAVKAAIDSGGFVAGGGSALLHA